MVLFISLGTFILVFCVVLLIYQFRGQENENIQNRLDRFFDLGSSSSSEEKSENAQPEENAGTIWAIIRRLSKLMKAPKTASMIEHRLTQAGIPLRGSEFLVIWIATTVIAVLLAFMLSKGSIILIAIGGFIGYLLPDLYLKRKAKLRLAAFNSQLGDALILIANSLRTGYSFLQSVELVSREMQDPIASEFARALREMNFGVLTEDALNNMAKRVISDDLELVITAVVIQRQVGGNLAEILDKIAGTIRARVRLKGQVKTLTAQGRVSGYVIGGIPFIMALIIYVVNPKYMGLMITHKQGQMALIVAGLMQIMGIWMISRIVDIKE